MQGKTILLGVSGGIAAFKAASICSQLTQGGADVRVIMMPSATEFVRPLTFQALSRNPVYTDTFEERDPSVISHIDLADSADLVIIAPATANIIGKLAGGIADDMLSSTLLATRTPVMIAPAMNVHMYAHPGVRENMDKLVSWGYRLIEPGEGQLACGYVGRGRLAEPEAIVQRAVSFFENADQRQGESFEGLRVLVTAGPTREAIDPVRYISNRSTGKMGYAVAEAAAARGAKVTLVSGPTALEAPAGVTRVNVETAGQMFDAVLERMTEQDVVIKAAAVGDYRPKQVHEKKMKKKDRDASMELERTPDILQTIGERKKRQILVGFAAETDRLREYARDKLQHKNLDMVVVNDVGRSDAGFASESNEVTVVEKGGQEHRWPLIQKREVADRLLDVISEYRKRSRS